MAVSRGGGMSFDRAVKKNERFVRISSTSIGCNAHLAVVWQAALTFIHLFLRSEKPKDINSSACHVAGQCSSLFCIKLHVEPGLLPASSDHRQNVWDRKKQCEILLNFAA